MSHVYEGTHNGRMARKVSKLGPGIITADRLEELLGENVGEPRTMPLLDLAELIDDLVGEDYIITRGIDGNVRIEELS